MGHTTDKNSLENENENGIFFQKLKNNSIIACLLILRMRNTLLSSEGKKFHIDFVEYLSLQGEMLRIRSRVRLRSVFAEPA